MKLNGSRADIDPGTVTSPSVKLSPNARNLVRVSCGTWATVTVKEHEEVAEITSVAMHWTGVAPIGNIEPDSREQLIAIGARPPDVVGFGNDTGTGAPLVVEAVTDTGQEIESGGLGGCGLVGGGSGAVGVLHPAVTSATATSHATSSCSTAARMDTAILCILQWVIWLS